MMFLVLVFPSSVFFPFQLHHSQQAEAITIPFSSPSPSSLLPMVPPAFILIGDKISKLQLENSTFVDDTDKSIADYSKSPQGTISFGERFSLLVPQVSPVFKNVKSAVFWINADSANANNDFHVHMRRLMAKDTNSLYLEVDVISPPGSVSHGFTGSDKGLKVFLWWDVSFTDGTHQTYLAIVNLKGDPCPQHGWDYDPVNKKRCVDLNG
jgi:hypothetical protein